MLSVTIDRPSQSITADGARVLMIRAQAPKGAQAQPMDAVVLLDASASMGGDKFDRAGQACRALAEALRPEDRLSLLLFNSRVVPLIEGVGGSDAVAAVEKALRRAARPAGTTRLDLALGHASGRLGRRNGRARLGVLVTDGHPTDERGQDLTDTTALEEQAQALAATGAKLTAIALGPADDFNSGLLFALCQTGGGAFHHAATASALSDRLLAAIGPAQTVADTQARLRVRRKYGGIDLRRACCIHPLYRALPVAPTSDGSDGWEIAVGEMELGETDLLLQVEVTAPGSAARQGSYPLLEVALDLCGQTLTGEASLDFTRSYAEANRIHDRTEQARKLWELEFAMTELRGAGDDDERYRHYSKIETLAQQAGRSELEAQARKMRKTLEANRTVGQDDYLSIYVNARRRSS